MKSVLIVFIAAASAFAQDVVFRGRPESRVFATPGNDDRQKLEAGDSQKSECVIVKRGKKYFWASRGNAPLNRADTPNFTYFVHPGGAGYVKIFTGPRNVTVPADYLEHISREFEVVTYWGRAQTVILDKK
jgi:hypothetical protein